MKKIGTYITDEEKQVEDFLAAAGAPINGQACCYTHGVAPVASPSYHGVESSTWHVASKGEKVDFFLRIGVKELAPFIDADIALKAAHACHDLGLSPQVLAADNSINAMLFDYLDETWQVATIDRLMVPDMAAKLIAMQKQIAALAPFGRRWCIFDGIADFHEKLRTLDVDMPVEIDWMMAWMATIREAISASGVDFKPAHGDPHSSNILIHDNKSLQIVDFDMGGDMDPYYSLGVLMNELYSFEEEMRPLIEMYEGSVRENIFCRCRAYAAADDLYWTLRALFMENCSQNHSLEFLKYASWRALRCRMLLGHPDFERTVRKI